jgi:flagellar protein FliS
MAATQQVNAYLNAHYDGMSPEQLILMLYNGALSRLKLVKDGINEGDMKKKGENLSKVIAIVSELHACVDSTMEDESTQFLIGLYQSILNELPKVTISNDLKTVDMTIEYIAELKRIWETSVMGKQPASEEKSPQQVPHLKTVPPRPVTAKPKVQPLNTGYPPQAQQAFRAFSV